MLKEHERTFGIFQKSTDIAVSAISWGLAYYIRFIQLPHAESGVGVLFLQLFPFLALLNTYFFHKNDLYKSQRFNSRYREILSVFKAHTQGFLSFVIFLYFLYGEKISRVHLLIYFAIAAFSFILVRISIRNFLRYLRRKGKNLRYILLVGDGKQLVDYIHTVYDFKDAGIRFSGWLEPGKLAGTFDNIEVLDGSLLEKKEEISPDSIVIGYSTKNSHRVEEILKDIHNDIIPIQVLPDLPFSFIGQKVEDFAGVPLISVNTPNFSQIDLFLKRMMDLVLCSIGVLLISPFLAIIAIAVKVSSPGPILFGQRRMGLDGQEFRMWKFRTMKVASDEDQTTEWSNKDNPRKTVVGNFLRKTSLDELPQLWNVIAGDMSLVGPRPEQPYFVDKFRGEIPLYMLRHKMKAGITGWAQVNGWRGDTDLNKRIECDIFYIKNWSLWLDIKIIFLTFWKGFINKNAY